MRCHHTCQIPESLQYQVGSHGNRTSVALCSQTTWGRPFHMAKRCDTAYIACQLWRHMELKGRLALRQADYRGPIGWLSENSHTHQWVMEGPHTTRTGIWLLPATVDVKRLSEDEWRWLPSLIQSFHRPWCLVLVAPSFLLGWRFYRESHSARCCEMNRP